EREYLVLRRSGPEDVLLEPPLADHRAHPIPGCQLLERIDHRHGEAGWTADVEDRRGICRQIPELVCMLRDQIVDPPARFGGGTSDGRVETHALHFLGVQVAVPLGARAEK